MDVISVYASEDIPEDMEFSSNGTTEYAQVVTYDVIPATIVFNEKQEPEQISTSLPTNKHAGTIRMYKPELKSFTRVPAGADLVRGEMVDSLKYICSICQKAFDVKENMERHLLLHTVVRFSCDECGRDFSNTHNLNLHKGKHDRLRKKQAEKVINSRSEQNSQGLESRKFKCSHCDLRYSTASKRNVHEKSHSSDKPFMCEQCGLAFRSKAGLYDHQVGHKGLRNHLCHLCPSTFVRSRNLLKHIRFVHGLVQIKTVVEGERIIEFVTPEQAPVLIEERKNNQESNESINARKASTQKRKQQQESYLNLSNNTTTISTKSSGPQKKKARKHPEPVADSDEVSEDDIIDEDILQHIKSENSTEDDDSMSS